MLYAVDPPDCSNYAGRHMAPRISRSIYGPAKEVDELLVKVGEDHWRCRTGLKNETALCFVDVSEDDTLRKAGVQFVNKLAISKMIAGLPLNEVA